MSPASRPPIAQLLRPVLSVLAAATVCACAGLPGNETFAPSPALASSPVAQEVLANDAKAGPYPTFAEVPPTPQDIRPASAWSNAIIETLNARRQMEALAQVTPLTLSDSEAFAAAARAQAKAPPPPTETRREAEQTDIFARQQRERATLPSPAH